MTSRPDYPVLALRKGEERRLRAGHLWVYSNEVDVAKTPLTGFVAGAPVQLVDHGGRPLGTGYVNPGTLIAARLVDRSGRALDAALLRARIDAALALRARLYDEPYYRLVFGESDGLPGLTVDRFGDVLVAQATTAGMERLRAAATEALLAALAPRVLVWKNDSSARAMEGLAESVEVVHGVLDGPVVAREGGVEFLCDLREGQKTGWFYDQRANRDALSVFVKGARVLDMFSYLGAWGLRAAAMGAREVVCVDASAPSVAAIETNARRNGLQDRVRAGRADAFDFLKALREQREHFDVVILDPPAFVKRKKDFKEGALAYRRLNELAMQVLARDGILVTCSCSYHMPREALLQGVQQGARHLERNVQVLMGLQQAPDHPVHPAIPETDYLKGFVCRVLPA